MVTHSAPIPKDLGYKGPAEVHAIGVYEGTVAGLQRKANHPMGNVTVRVPKRTVPTILVLTSYEPVQWNIEAAKGSVLKVVLNGYHEQKVTGLPKEIEVIAGSFKTGDKDFFYAYQKDKDRNRLAQRANRETDYDKLVRRVKELTQQELLSFQGKYTGASFEVPIGRVEKK